jgi:hypothetical protein
MSHEAEAIAAPDSSPQSSRSPIYVAGCVLVLTLSVCLVCCLALYIYGDPIRNWLVWQAVDRGWGQIITPTAPPVNGLALPWPDCVASSCL